MGCGKEWEGNFPRDSDSRNPPQGKMMAVVNFISMPCERNTANNLGISKVLFFSQNLSLY